MAFPTIPTVAAGRVLTAVQANTTAARTFPSLTGLTKNSGDLLIAICVCYQTTAAAGSIFSSWGGGFTEFGDVGGSSNTAVGVAYKWSTGSETGTFTVTQAATITGHAVMYLLSIPGAHATTPPEEGAIANGTAAAADPAALTPTWGAEDTLWISLAIGGETSLTGSFTGVTSATAPTNYSGTVDTTLTADAVGGVDATIAFRQLNAASENVGAWSAVDLSNARNSALVIAVRPAPAVSVDSPALELSSFGTFAVVDANDTINHVTVGITHHEVAGAGAPTFELWDGASAKIGATQTGTASTSDHTDTFDFTGVTYSQLATLRVRVYGHASSTLVESVDSASLTVNYTAVAGGGVTPFIGWGWGQNG